MKTSSDSQNHIFEAGNDALVVDPSTLNFEAVGAAFVQTFAVSEGVRCRKLHRKASGCGGIITIAAKKLVPDWTTRVATETVTPVAAGSAHNRRLSTGVQTANVPAVVTTTGVGVNAR